ncbi:PaaI family thioesterase [Bradyrhizobium sp. CB3481]|uniref:hotdog domain-containing protein n=1 Tax=Bradyrhizobium sp. CB3481 TaxID=3039158 RepID=UPI0024B1517D|nr:PaaI family thioesterase [Bradyrhizobium sp. CB3481]WFU15985.1 PaaI family thioesterase [Bradyrhizobium sp. CB3481]
MSEITVYDGQPLPFEQLTKAIAERRSLYGRASGLRIDRAERGEAWSSLPYQSVFAGDTQSGVIHGGVVTAMLDESCGMAVQLALDGSRAIATLDLRIDYQKPAKPGLDIKAHAICYHVTRSIAFVRATAYQETEQDPVATAAACFMIGANRTNMLQDREAYDVPTLDLPEEDSGPFANSPFARCLGIGIADDGVLHMPFSSKLIGNPVLPAIHGGITGAFLETTAIIGVARELGIATPPKPIGLTINYLRSGRALDSFANVSIVKQGLRIVAFQAQAWQDDASKPIATAFGHFKLRQAADKD